MTKEISLAIQGDKSIEEMETFQPQTIEDCSVIYRWCKIVDRVGKELKKRAVAVADGYNGDSFETDSHLVKKVYRSNREIVSLTPEGQEKMLELDAIRDSIEVLQRKAKRLEEEVMDNHATTKTTTKLSYLKVTAL